MNVAAAVSLLFSVLVPAKMWFAPNQPIMVNIKSETPIVLMMTDFTGKPVEAKGATEVAGGKDVDIKAIFPDSAKPGTYVLYAVPKGKKIDEFAGTPLVIEVRSAAEAGIPQEAIVVRVEPLRYAVMHTDLGDMTMVFWFDVAPATANSFLTLASEGYYDGLTFHRIVPGFVVQGGDPHGSGMGGPGYNISAEFNDRKHEEGVLSMARQGDPREQAGAKPAPQFANSAGSQFFICLNYEQTRHLDGKYTGFGQVVGGKETYKALEKVPLADPRAGKPEKTQVIKKVEVKAVTAANNPYKAMLTPK